MSEDHDIQIVAYHEAGHAAVDFYFGHGIEGVSIRREGDAAGHVAFDRSGDDALRYEDDTQKQVPFERRIMAAMAGEIAQRRFAPDSVEVEHGLSDQRLAREYIESLDEVAPTDEIRAEYWRLLALRTEALIERLWPRVERIAAALVEHETLTAEEAHAAFVDPARAALLSEGDEAMD